MKARDIISGFFLAAMTFSLGVAMSFIFKARPAAPQRGEARQEAPGKTINKTKARCMVDIAPITYGKVASLREIDYRNLSYPEASDCSGASEAFQLRHGVYGTRDDGMKFREVSFGDISGDKQAEAVVTFEVLTDGYQPREAVYVFTLERKQPKVIYVFWGADRAEGAVRRAYAKGGRLVLELWGPGNTLEVTGGSDRTGLCCPRTFTRSRYVWRDGAFQADGSPEILPNPRADEECPMCDH